MTPGPGPALSGHVPAASAARDGYDLWVDPAGAGWGYSSLRVLTLAPGEARTLDSGDSEWIVLPLAGGCSVAVDGEVFELRGRRDVFGGVSDFAYVPRDARAVRRSAPPAPPALSRGATTARRSPRRW